MNILVTSKVISLDRKLSIFVKLFAVHNINWAIDNAQASFADNGFNEWRCGSTSVSLRRDRRCRALPSAHLRCLHLQNRLPPSTHQVQPNRWLFVNSWRRNDAMFILHLAFIIWKSSMDKLSSRERRYYFWTIFSDVIHLQRYRNGIRTENFIQRRLFHFLLTNFDHMRKIYCQKLWRKEYFAETRSRICCVTWLFLWWSRRGTALWTPRSAKATSALPAFC